MLKSKIKFKTLAIPIELFQVVSRCGVNLKHVAKMYGLSMVQQ